MDGNGRWAKERGLPRTKGHEQGEHSLFDVVEGAIEIGVKAISAYAFSTENWSRSPDEVKFLMGFNRDVIRRRRDEMHELGVRVRWAGRAPRLWKSVIRELQVAEELTRKNDVLTLTMCVNYGGRAELADTARSIAREVAAGRLDPEKVDEKTFARHLYVPEQSDADLVWRTSGEQRLSNFMLWQAAYAELVFTDVLWPDVDRRHLWQAIDLYARRDRGTAGPCSELVAAGPWRGWPTPGAFQLVFTGLYAIDVGVRVAFGSWFGFVCGPGFALMAAPLLLVLGLAVPWDRLDPRVALVLPVADIAIVGFSRLAPEGGNGLLAVFPALWLGRQWGRVGARRRRGRDGAVHGGPRGGLHRLGPAPALAHALHRAGRGRHGARRRGRDGAGPGAGRHDRAPAPGQPGDLRHRGRRPAAARQGR